MVLAVSAEQSAEALKAIISTALESSLSTYFADEVPGANGGDSKALPGRWCEVGVSRSFGGAYRLSGSSSSSLHYVTVGTADSITTNVRRWQERARAAIEGVQVDVGDGQTSPVRFYAQDDVTYLRDLARYWQITTYSFAT